MSEDAPDTSPDSVPEKNCRNCGAAVTGRYCVSCGQPEGRSDLHFSEAVGELAGDVFAWDSRFWRTLFGLLFRPGFISAEFNAGRRARYMPPFRLYISISFIMFLLLSLNASNAILVSELDEQEDDSSLMIGLDPNGMPEELRERVDEARGEAKETRDASSQDSILNLDLDEDAPDWLRNLEARLETNAQRVGDDPRDFIGELLEYLPQAMFVMLPFFALLLKLAYLFRPFHYLQHLVFALHYHSFVYLLYMISSGLEWIGLPFVSLLFLVLIAYLPLSLRTCYQSGWAGAIFRSLLLYFVYGIALLLGMIVVALSVLVLM